MDNTIFVQGSDSKEVDLFLQNTHTGFKNFEDLSSNDQLDLLISVISFLADYLDRCGVQITGNIIAIRKVLVLLKLEVNTDMESYEELFESADKDFEFLKGIFLHRDIFIDGVEGNTIQIDPYIRSIGRKLLNKLQPIYLDVYSES